ncbi:MAG: hypothetical protein V1249_00845 [Acidimicrobiales bacterium]|nr:hypothetical protein [Acidimicrobiales bacterium]
MAPKSSPQLLMAVAILFIHLRPCTFLDPTRNSPGRGAGSGQGEVLMMKVRRGRDGWDAAPGMQATR